MSIDVERYACNCCTDDDCPAPQIDEDACGFTLSKSSFHVDVRDDIPDSAEKMRWLTYYRPRITEADIEYQIICDPTSGNPGNWYTRNKYTTTGFYYNQEYDPDDGCSLINTGGGSETSLYEHRGTYSSSEVTKACEVSPDNTVTDDRYESGTWSYDDGDGRMEYDWTGTENGSPISGQKILGSSRFPAAAYPDAGDITETLSMVTTGIKVVETNIREWDVVDGRHYFGEETLEEGYANPHFRYTVTVPTHAEVLYMAIEAEVYFTPDGGSESLIDTEEIEWMAGDPSREFSFTPSYSDFGTFRVVLARYRRSPVGHWTDGSEEIDTSD